jgi:hypothetical protein
MTIVTYSHRPQRSTRKPKPVAPGRPAVARSGRKHGDAERVPATHPAPADADRKAVIVTTTNRKRLKLMRAERSPDADAAEVSPAVKAFFARMVRPGGALPPKR